MPFLDLSMILSQTPHEIKKIDFREEFSKQKTHHENAKIDFCEELFIFKTSI